MPEQETAREKVDNFLNRLMKLGYDVQWISDKPQVCSVDGKRVNIRSTSNVKKPEGSRTLWYSVSENVLAEVDYVALMTPTSGYVVLLPTGFVLSIYEEMYPDESKPSVRNFLLDWDELEIKLKDRRVSVEDYDHDMSHEDRLPRF